MEIFWENGFFESQNNEHTRILISYSRWQELLKAQTEGYEIFTDEFGYPSARIYAPSTLEINTQRINELKNNLLSTDYKVIKYIEGELTPSEYEKVKIDRQKWRSEINIIEKELKLN